MRDLLARRLLAKVMGKDDLAKLTEITSRLQTLASLKYDDYEGYGPGVKFVESLAVWLQGFEASDRLTALQFVDQRLAFISGPEMDHLVSTVYRDILRPRFLRQAAEATGIPAWRVAKLSNSVAFRSIQRRALIFGMSDGARLDKLRRSSELSTEQIHLVSQLDPLKAADMKDALSKALNSFGDKSDATFSTVFVVDDFSASGTSMLRSEDGVWKGKLVKIRDHVEELKQQGVVADNARVVALIYLLTDNARTQLQLRMEDALNGGAFELIAAHTFDPQFPLSTSRQADQAFIELCEKYYRSSWENEHTKKGGPFRLGYADCALPLVLHHNAPNNTPPIVWKEEALNEVPPTMNEWFGVFPRHERHHPGRP